MQSNAPADKTPHRDFRLQKIVARHQKPSRLRSSWQLINSIVPGNQLLSDVGIGGRRFGLFDSHVYHLS
jgi:hypothetical protein